MEVAIDRKQTAFRLSTDLLDRLRLAAKKQNRSLNNFVESILMDVVYNEPNEETKEAIAEAKAGEFAGTIDVENFDTFMKSIKNKISKHPLQIDYLYISKGYNGRIEELTSLFRIRTVVLDVSLSDYRSDILKNDCCRLAIPCIALKERGALCIHL